MEDTLKIDVLFTGGAVFTGSGEPLSGFAVALQGDRIVALAPQAELEMLADEQTKRVSLAGALLSPGFQDAHVHPILGGIELLQCNLTETRSAEEAVATVAAYAEANPNEPWILGGGWSMEHFPGGTPTRELLDAVVPDRPVFLKNRDHHGGWANTAAIRLAAIDATTVDPEDGRIEREGDGFPAGTFHEGATDLFDAVKPKASADLAYNGLLRAQDELIALGITGWQDAGLGEGGVGVSPVTYVRALDEGTLLAHVAGAQWWERDQGLEQIEQMVEWRKKRQESGQADRFELGTVKLMVDGVAENFTASMLEPYRDADGHDTCNHGISFIDRETMIEAAIKLDAAGFQLHFHSLGDRAVRDALDAVQAAKEANGPSDGRHHLAHLQVVAEADTSRFAELNAIANMQALWAAHEQQLDELTLPFLQDGAEKRQYPFGEMHARGCRLAAGSDWPVSSADPIWAVHVAVNRVQPGHDRPPLGGSVQQLDLATALAAYTSGSAYVNHRDHDTGSIQEGYLANLVVVRPNPFDLAPTEIHSAKVVSTWIAGERVYAAE